MVQIEPRLLSTLQNRRAKYMLVGSLMLLLSSTSMWNLKCIGGFLQERVAIKQLAYNSDIPVKHTTIVATF